MSKQYPLHKQKLLVPPPPGLVHNQNSKVCLFVCLSVCLIFRTNKNYALLGINLRTSLINIRSTNKNYQRPPPSRLFQTIDSQICVCFSVCLYFFFLTNENVALLGINIRKSQQKYPLHEQKILAPPPGLSRRSILKFAFVFLFACIFFPHK